MSWKRLFFLVLTLVIGGNPALADGDAVETDVEKLHAAGVQALEERQMLQAERTFQRCLEIDSTFYDAYLSLARMYMSKRSLEPAARFLLEAMRQNPERSEAFFEYSQILSRQGKGQEAYAYLRRVLALEPQTVAAYMGIGYLRMHPNQLMDLQEAGEAFAKALELEPENYEAAFNLGKVYLQQGKLERASELYQGILADKPEHFATLYQLGIAAYLRGEYARAADVLQRAVSVSPGNLIGRRALYLVYQHLEGYENLPESQRLEFAVDEEVEDAGVRLVDAALQAGVERRDLGRGSAWADYDGDGDLDLFTMGSFSGLALYRNDGKDFSEHAEEAGLVGKAGMGCLFGDFDNDGDPDLYIVRDGWYGASPNSLYRNEGNGTFADIGSTSGVADEGSGFTTCWGDLDNDGNLDLVVTNGVTGDGTPNRLYLGDGQGQFKDVGEEAGIRPGRSIGSALGDYDNDGDLDLYVANFSGINTFYRNDGELNDDDVVFTDVTQKTRTQLPVGGYFTFFFDFDNDGDLDLFCSELSDYTAVVYSEVNGRTRLDRNRPSLYRNEADGTFADVTYRTGLGRSFGTTGVHYGDFNNDGYPDIYLGNGGEEMTRFEADVLLLNIRGERFVDIAPQIGLEQMGKGHGVSFADYDGDGDQDIYVPVGGMFPGDIWANRLYRNDSPQRSRLTLHLIGERSNRDGIGARVRVRAGGKDRHALVSSGGGGGGDNSLQLELGLGEAETVEELEIRWPSGQVDLWEDLEVNQYLTVREGEAPQGR